jgi:hypothetical protein
MSHQTIYFDYYYVLVSLNGILITDYHLSSDNHEWSRKVHLVKKFHITCMYCNNL